MKTMKTIITIIAVAFVAIATAVEKPKMNVIPLSADRSIIALSNNTPALFEVSVFADNGALVYYKQSNKKETNYRKIFDFKALEEGNYEIQFKVNDTKIKRDLVIDANDIVVGAPQLSYDPFIVFNEGQLKVSYLNFDEEKLSLNIFSKGDLLYKSELGKDFAINAGYNLNNLPKGKYDITISGNDNLYTYSIEK